MIRVRITDSTFPYKNTILEAEDKSLLLDFLRDHGYSAEAPCGGHGTCGKCLVGLSPFHANPKAGSLQMVRSCTFKITEDCQIFVKPQTKKDEGLMEKDGLSQKLSWSFRTGIGAAVDLGTTTVVVSLYDLSTGEKLGTSSEWNCQSTYGADVISRIQYCIDRPKGLDIIGRKIRRQVRLMIQSLIDKSGNPSPLQEVTVAGNTIMQHIFTSLDPSSIAFAPFLPSTCFEGKDAEIELPEFRGCKVILFPCISGYVGGDITAGLLSTDLCHSSETFLFLDIGTNGEMVLGSPDGMTCCSVASGPAFEGAEISCGMRSTGGAVNHVSKSEDRIHLSIIGPPGTKPRGICGSGLIDLLAILLREGIVDESGRMLSPNEIASPLKVCMTEDENGNGIFWLDKERTICFRPEDVRKLQLAKAAIAAGIRILINKKKLTYDQIDHVYIAGGFGRHLLAENMVRTGMFPGELSRKLIAIGNSSLTGAQALLSNPEYRKELLEIRNRCAYLELSLDPDFSEEYVEQMMF